MKKIISTFLFSALITACALTISNAQETEVRSLSAFNGISASSSIDAEFMKGTKNEVKITVNDIELNEVTSEVEGGILKLGIKSKKSNWNWTKSRKVKAIITYSGDLGYLSVSSSADLVGKNKIVGDDLELSASSSGDMKIEVEVKTLEVSVSSSADLNISGTADEAEISVSSSGDFLGKNLVAGNADLKVSSSGDAEIHVKNSITARASSSGDITYYGNPAKKDINKSSGGDVTAKN